MALCADELVAGALANPGNATLLERLVPRGLPQGVLVAGCPAPALFLRKAEIENPFTRGCGAYCLMASIWATMRTSFGMPNLMP